jgi:hypothetical protein
VVVLIKQKKYLWQAKILPKGSLSLRFDTGHLSSEHIIFQNKYSKHLIKNELIFIGTGFESKKK